MQDDSERDRIAVAFRLLYDADARAGRARTLAEYLQRFEGQDDVIAAEYLLVRRPDGAEQAGGTPASPTPDGAAIGPYRIVRQIGRGGQATVYLAEDPRLHRLVALKVLDPGPGADATAFQRFRREAEITSKLDHPGICAVYETGEERGTLWIAMRYVDGDSVARRIAAARKPGPAAPGGADPSGPRTWAELSTVLAFVEKAARTLHVAHESGVIHRDIKPGNLIITRDGDPVILDFGLAQDDQAEHPTLTQSSDTLGTPAYMSPEQIAAHRGRLDRRTDVYSLGVTLYESLTLSRPFSHPTREGLYRAILTHDPPDPRALNPAVTRDLAVVLDTALEKDRDRRYQTALDLAEDLRRVRVHEPILAKPAGALLRIRRWMQRNPALATAIGGILVALAISIVLLVQVSAERNQKQAALDDYDRLGDRSRLERLVAEADLLWPAVPSEIPALKAWVDRASELARRLDGHAQALDRMRQAGTAIATESRQTDSRAIASRPVWRLEAPAEQFKHDTTTTLVADLAAFVDPDPAKGLLANVRRRLTFAEVVEEETITKRTAAWANAMRSISDTSECPKYRGLHIRPQLGLIPVGRDPGSGLWEFAHLETTAPGTDPTPGRDAGGRLVVTDGMGIVFVLIPGGTFTMGAIKPDENHLPTDPNVDADAQEAELPLNPVALDPFFLSKYEMTQGQWVRTSGRNPSAYGSGGRFTDEVVDFRCPVETVSFDDCDLWLSRLGLILPTEAQWEYAARGGTTTPRWIGIGTAGIEKAANVADESARRSTAAPNWSFEAWDDGHPYYARVGSYAPNPFGLHDVLGNMMEWCRDWFEFYQTPADPGDGLRRTNIHRFRSTRGGSYGLPAMMARSASRTCVPADYRSTQHGVRPARRLDP